MYKRQVWRRNTALFATGVSRSGWYSSSQTSAISEVNSGVHPVSYTHLNTVLLSARELFPAGSVRLHGIKTFEKERIDIAILYAASILVKHCDTLKAIFLNIIQNNTKLLYNVESVTAEAGYGFTGWIEHNLSLIHI